MTLENGTYALFELKPENLLRKSPEIENWLGGRDLNPDTVVQSHVSYRWTTSQSGVPGRAETPIIYNPLRRNGCGRVVLQYHKLTRSG